MAKISKREWRKPNGEGSTAWLVSYYDATGKRARRQFDTKREADDFRIRIEGELRSGTYRPEAAKTLVKDVAERFIKHIEGRMQRRERMTPHNFHIYEGHVRNYICAPSEREAQRPTSARVTPFSEGLSHLRLEQLTARTVGDFRDRLRNAGVTVSTTRKILNTLRLLAGYAVSQDLLSVNPVLGIKVIGRRDEGPKKIMPPTKEAIRLLLGAADADFRIQLMFAAATGVRAGELHALRWRHIDFASHEVRVETRVDTYGNEDTTKTAAGLRSIPLSRTVLTELLAWRSRAPFANDDDLLFPNRRGGYLGHDNMVKRNFAPLFTKLADAHRRDPASHPAPPPRFNWHALRHFAISCWIEAGLSPKAVQTFAGHSSLQVTMDRYGHLFKSDDHSLAMNRIAGDIFKLG